MSYCEKVYILTVLVQVLAERLLSRIGDTSKHEVEGILGGANRTHAMVNAARAGRRYQRLTRSSNRLTYPRRPWMISKPLPQPRIRLLRGTRTLS